jgi:hypothetical protein
MAVADVELKTTMRWVWKGMFGNTGTMLYFLGVLGSRIEVLGGHVVPCCS